MPQKRREVPPGGKEGKTVMKYASNNIRNILIAGHAGSGKTTLTEALVYFSGASERMGRVEDGTTISDFDPEESKRKASLSASVVPVEYGGIKYNLIDAPGLAFARAACYTDPKERNWSGEELPWNPDLWFRENSSRSSKIPPPPSPESGYRPFRF